MTIGNDSELAALRGVCRLVATVLRAMQAHAQAGMTTAELDAFGERLLLEGGASPAPRKVYGFPGATCISVNEEAAHGIPGTRVLAPGDVVNVDVSAERDGFYGDTGGSFVIAPSSPAKDRLLEMTRRARDEGIKAATAGGLVSHVSRAIERVARRSGLRVIRNLTSHGVGAALHEEPAIYNYFDPRDTRRLHNGQVITVEPFLATRSNRVVEREDGWTLTVRPGSYAAQFEHTIMVRSGAPLVLTLPE
jgi:methionyl aminopeptidase